MPQRARICIAGAHTAVAKALVECLEERGIEADLRRVTTTELVEEGLDLIDDATLSEADLVVLAFRGEGARRLAEAARALGKPVLDMVEELAGDKRGRWLFPGIDPDAGASFDPALYAVIPIGLGAPIVAVLRALAPFQPTRATVATYESTASADQPGMDELSEQIRARFNMLEVEPRVFAGSIAFGSVPLVGRSGESPFDADEVLRRAIEDGLERELPDLDLSITRVLVPTFSADSAVLVVDLDREPSLADIEQGLRSARGIHFLGDEIPSSLDAIGRDDALVGRVSLEAGRVALWLACDRLRRGSATLGALAIERWLAARK